MKEHLLLNQLAKEYKVLGWYQLVGGVLGIGISCWLLSQALQHILAYLILSGAFALCLYSLYCGYLLIQQQPKGILLSQIHQALQVLHITVLGVSCEYTSGFGLTIGLDLTHATTLLFNSSFSGFLFKYSTSSEAFKIQVNIIAIALIVLLEKLKEKRHQHQVSRSID